ncbi:hypothetical protein QFC21_005698 [Naganishia friedmannii]|uniref:Uncharacterized protein n=1 Tax=Naganishia friedmannii TaxID=89922 RepID=A0ACC2V7R6_9TREE|nr:hypothetical protein QFC21_005698 [Naganishia friedmannii]
MSAQEVKPEGPVADAPVAETMAVDPTPAAAATTTTITDAVPSSENAASTEVSMAEFPEVLRGKTDEEITAIKKKIVEQLTFYFSDSNLFYDKFLWNLVCKSPEGYVPLETVASFKRMRDSLTTFGLAFIAQSVRDVHPAAGAAGHEIEVDPTGQRVRRTRTLERDTTAWDRTLYVKGFGQGAAPTGENSQERVEEWFKRVAEGVAAVRFRREGEGKEKNKGAFKGSVFVEFKTLSDAQAFVDMVPQPEFQGEPVVSMFKEQYVQMKVKEKGLDQTSISRGSNTRPALPNAKQFNAFRELEALKARGERLPEYVMRMGAPGLLENAPTGEGSAGKRKREDGDDAEGGRAEKKAKEDQFLWIVYNGKKLAVNRATGVVVDKAEIEYVPGKVLRFENAGADADWKQLKVDLSTLGYEKSFMNFPRGSTWGWFSLDEPISEEDFEKIKDAKLQANGELQWSRVTGDEELEFWATRASFQGKLAVKQADEKDAENAANNAAEGGRQFGGGGRGRGGRGRGGPRGGRGGGGRGGGRGRGGRGGNRGGNRDRDNGSRAAPNPQSAAHADAPPAI